MTFTQTRQRDERLFVLSSKACHCDGTGIVVMDDGGVLSTLGEPCPMCHLGHRFASDIVTGDLMPAKLDPKTGGSGSINRNRHIPKERWVNRDGRSISYPMYYERVNVDALSWNGGLTLEHRWECATINCRHRGFVMRSGMRCRSCLPDTQKLEIPSFRAIVKAAVRVREQGGLAAIYETARAEQAELDAADLADHQSHHEAASDGMEGNAA